MNIEKGMRIQILKSGEIKFWARKGECCPKGILWAVAL
jgi:hypothetical protein